MSIVSRTGLFPRPALLLYDAVDHRARALMQPELTDDRYLLYTQFCQGILSLATRLLEQHNETFCFAPSELLQIKAALKTAEQVWVRLQEANLLTRYTCFSLDENEARILDEFFAKYY